MPKSPLSLGLLISALAVPSLGFSGNEAAVMHGFTASHAVTQSELEARFDANLNANDLRGWLQQMSSAPNQIGSPHDKANAEFMLSQFKAWGWDASIETFYVLYPTPKRQMLELQGPKPYRASLSEPTVAADRTSANRKDVLPPYNVYGADGDVTAPIVYANYGMPDDYKDLARRGISVKGRIVLTRYGGGWRGLKPKLAYEHGAIGCLIYSDPRDDGYGAADSYPQGPGRPAQGLQRGSVADMPIYSGDPLTPNVGATKDAPRLSIAEAKSILKIPVMPISYQDARPFLESLGGPVAPSRWRGGLAMTYHVGPSTAKAHLVIQSEWSQKPIYDVIAKMKGSELPDEWVIRGNHHDGWVYGAEDPLSGNVAMMSEMKALGALAAQGWKPKRTLIYASWDGEEAGLLGSTEWVETHAQELAQHAVAYVNSDGNSHGFFGAGGSPSLQRLVDEVAAGVKDPISHTSVLSRARAHTIVTGVGEGRNDEHAREARDLLNGGELALEPLGSGSDFTPFLQHAGIASLNLGFGNSDPSGVYHSIYDSFDHYVKFNDPTFGYGVALAEVAGHIMMRLADADLLPLRMAPVASNISHYAEEVESLTERLRAQTLEMNRVIDDKAFELGADSADPVGAPPREAPVPHLNFAPLKNSAAALSAAAAAFDEAYAAAINHSNKLDLTTRKAIDDDLRRAEQSFLSSTGLPGRGWYRHMIVAPGLYTGYGAKTIPGVREAIEERHWADTTDTIASTSAAIESYKAVVEAATAKLKAL